MNIVKSIVVWTAGIIFIIFFFPLTFLIWLISLPFDKKRTITHWILIYQSLALTRIVPIWKVKIEGREKFPKGMAGVIISNHQSILDILLINCLRYRFRWISKLENTKVPVLGWYLRMADYITVDRGNSESKEDMLEKSYQCLRQNISIVIFPEGTRSVNGEIGFFRRGAFQLAINAKKPVIPVIIDGSGGVLPKHGLVFNAGHMIKIKVFDPVMPDSFNTDDPDTLSLRFGNFMTEALREMRDSK